MNPQHLPMYIAGAEALLGMAARHFHLGAAPAPQAPAVPNFMLSSFTKMSPMYVVLCGGVVFLGLVSFDGVRRVRKLEKALAAAGVLK